MKTKKAQGLSMNTIIIAAIALVVLVVLVVLVIQYTNKVPEATSCENTGGICVPKDSTKTNFQVCNDREVDGKTWVLDPASCAGSPGRPVCCRPVG